MANAMSGAPDVLDPRVLVDGFYRAFGHNHVERLNHIVDKDSQDVPLAPGQQSHFAHRPSRRLVRLVILGQRFPE